MSDLTIWMPIYWGDYLRDTAHLSTVEHGGYMLLIAHYWTTGKPLPSADDRLRRITRMERRDWLASRSALLAFFTPDGDTLRHKRVDAEIARSSVKSAKRKIAGSEGAKRRWQNDSNCHAVAKALPSEPVWQNDRQSQSQSQSQTQTESIQNAKSRTRGTRMVAGWQLDDDGRAFAGSLGLDADKTSQEFCDYWLAKAGPAGIKADWPATWRNWCRRSASYVQRPAGSGQGRFVGSNLDEAIALAANIHDSKRRRPAVDLGLPSSPVQVLAGPRPDEDGGKTDGVSGQLVSARFQR